MKSVFAAVIGAIGGSLIFLLISQLVWHSAWQVFYDFNREYFENDDAMPAITPTVTCATMALPLLLAFGLPIQALLQRLKLTQYSVNVVPCFVLAALSVWSLRSLIPFSQLDSLIFGAGLGFCIGMIAWLIRRPDLDTKQAVAKEAAA